ncbi:hypothetical protein EIP91_007648 [Steccherinum ochraceum]|uniref:Uncharacterized protein n=1 Tax=Steccherinum ochraceum TaxID=92696 RepID=A0A4R0RI47_9APHY|nr:hypothetical protein EIP91_007648 [Steccherinum ochraceum]
MTSLLSASSSFSALSSPGDAIAVLVLVESSSQMIRYWDDVKTFYLPKLLDTLRNAHDAKTIPMRVCWQTSQTVFSGNQGSSAADVTGKEIPDFRFDPASTSAVTTTALRYSIETLKAAFRDQHATRHFILVAASSPAGDHNHSLLDHNVLQSVASTLRQESIRLHMILATGQSTEVFRELHHQVLRPQSCSALSLWFNADSAKFKVLLMGKPSNAAVEGATTLSSALNMTSGSSQSSGTPVSSGSSLPSSPTLHDSSERRKSVSPQTRRGRPGALEQPAHGLVSYLQQMHGLTKKRTYGASKTAKRASTGDAPRPSSSTRPILPRLDLPEQRSRAFAPYPTMGSPTSERPSTDKYTSSPPKYVPIAPASTPNSPSDDGRRSHSRFPWIQPGPLAPLSSGSSSTTSGAANALRSLAMMTPRHPDMAARLPDLSLERGGPPVYAGTSVHESAGMQYNHGVPAGPSYHTPRDGADWHYRQRSSTIATSNPTDYRMSATPSPTITAPSYDPAWIHGYPPPHDHIMSPHDHGFSTHNAMIPPPPISQQSSSSDPEDQPFVLSPEFEALANARYDEAIRSGAMRASMTAATLGPVAGEPMATGPASMHMHHHHHSAGPPVPVGANISAGMHQMHQPPYAVPVDPTSMIPHSHLVAGPSGPAMHPFTGDLQHQIPHSGHLPSSDPSQDRWYGL